MNFNYGGWVVHYGCSEWQDTDRNLKEEQAKTLFHDYCTHPPVRGNRAADYVLLENDRGIVVNSCAIGGSYD